MYVRICIYTQDEITSSNKDETLLKHCCKALRLCVIALLMKQGLSTILI